MDEDEEIVYDFSCELHKNKQVYDHTFERAEKRFGKKGVVDLTAINAYYTPLVMEMNVARYETPKDGKTLTRFPECRKRDALSRRCSTGTGFIG